jgi:hypothetical protein
MAEWDEPIRKKGFILNFQTKKLQEVHDKHIVRHKNPLIFEFFNLYVNFYRSIHHDQSIAMRSLIHSDKARTESFTEFVINQRARSMH